MNAAIYARVSTTDRGQDTDVQVVALGQWVERLGYGEPDEYIEEGVSGAKTSRPELDRMMKAVRRREYDAVAVWRLDRLGRSLLHLLQLLGEFEDNGVRLLVNDQALDTGTPQGRLFFQIAGAFGEYERAMIAERVHDGIRHAQRHGTKSGLPIGRPPSGIDFWTILDTASCPGCETVAAQARTLGVGRATLYRLAEAAGYVWDRDAGWLPVSETLSPEDRS